MKTISYLKQLKNYKKDAYNYFSNINLCPTPEEIVDYVCDCVEEESGCDVDKYTYQKIAKELGMVVD